MQRKAKGGHPGVMSHKHQHGAYPLCYIAAMVHHCLKQNSLHQWGFPTGLSWYAVYYL